MLSSKDIRPSEILEKEYPVLLEREKMLRSWLKEIQIRHLRSIEDVNRGVNERKTTEINTNIRILNPISKIDPKELELILKELDQIYDIIGKTDSHYVYVRRGRPLTINKIQTMISQLQNKNKNELEGFNLILLQYYLSRDKLFIFVITSSSVDVKIVPVSLKKIYIAYENYYKEVVNYNFYGDIGLESIYSLSKYLIEPVSENLINSQKDYINNNGDKNQIVICFVPHGILHFIPLHALMLNDDYIIKKYPIFYSHSASMLQFYDNEKTTRLRKYFGFALKKGQEKYLFKEEVLSIAKLFDSQLYIDPDENLIKNNLNADILHFATHGNFDSESPLDSSIQLVNNKKLTAREIFDLKLNSELVTLSACQTGLSKVSGGDDLVGLTRAFIYAGTASILVSLWSVFDKSTRDLMVDFYDNLKNKKMSKVKALQHAQIKFMKSNTKYSHPYYWAPFILVGDWE